MDEQDRVLLHVAGRELGLELTGEQIDRLLRLRDLLLEWNARINLTAIADPQAVVTRHLVDSLACLIAIDDRREDLRVLDVGSGAGFPGLVLAIALPQWHVTTLEATAKKVRFQEAVIAALALTNASAVSGRAEDLAHDPAWRGTFDIVVARAVAALPVLLEWLQPFARVGGIVLAPKKGDLGDELARGSRAARTLGGAAPEMVTLPASLLAVAPDLADGRAIARVRQLRPAPARFPRAAAATKRDPLGSQPDEPLA
jgi:16S rRNA (guanine527-N7)-methyltransferase